jgi:hypothetical protein
MPNRPLTAKDVRDARARVMTEQGVRRTAKALVSNKKHIFNNKHLFNKTRFKALTCQ